MIALTGLTRLQILHITAALTHPPRAGRPWALLLACRVVLAAAALPTNLTVRQLAAIFEASKSQAHPIIGHLTLRSWRDPRQRRSRTTTGTPATPRSSADASDLLVIAVDGAGPGNRNDPVHHQGSKVQRRCQVHGRVLADGGYRAIAALHTPTFAGGRIVRDHAGRRHRRRRARAEHCIA